MADLTTTAAVKAYAGVTTSGDDAAIGGLVSAVSAYLHGIVGHDFDGASITGEHHSGPVSGALVLAKPAATIDAVRVDGTTLDATGYELEEERLLWRVASGEVIAWRSGKRNIEVDYTTTTTVPADLELAARELGAFAVKQSSLGTGGARLGLSGQANADSGSADYFVQALAALPFTKAAIDRYRRIA